MKIIFAIALLSISHNTFAQYAKASQYYSQINTAEMMIVRGALDSAQVQYAAIPNKQKLFRDLYNNFVLLRDLDLRSKATNICYEMATRGADSTFFGKSVFGYLDGLVVYDLKQKAHKEFVRRQQKNAGYVAQMDSLFNWDQGVTGYWHTIQSRNGFPDSLGLINDKIISAQLKLIREYGFPSEQKLGPAIDENKKIIDATKHIVIAIHCLQMSKNQQLQEEVREVFLAAYFNKELSQMDLFSLQDLSGIDTNVVFPPTIVTVDDKIFKEKGYDSSWCARSREQYSLPTVQENIDKVLFSAIKKQDYNFRIQSNYRPNYAARIAADPESYELIFESPSKP